jgi:acetoin utilization protein AcuB
MQWVPNSMKERPSIAAYMTAEPSVVESGSPLPDAVKVMRTRGIRHLPVVSAGRLVGILSKHDVSRMAPLVEAPPSDVAVEDVMTDDPYVVSPSTPLDEVATEMAERKIGSAVIVEEGEVVGVFTTNDALRALADVIRGRPDKLHGAGAYARRKEIKRHDEAPPSRPR